MKYLIHVEKVWDEVVWENLIEFIKKQKSKCHLFIMPPQYEYQKAIFGYRKTGQELEKILKERYSELKILQKEYGFKVGIHIHFCLYPKELSEEEKNRTFNEYQKWVMEFFDIKSIAFGWFKMDQYLKDLCIAKGIEIKHYGFLSINIHDYDLPISKSKIIENLIKDNLRRLLR